MRKLIVISAVWCPSCLLLNKHLKEIEKVHSDIEIIKYDYDLDEDEIKKYDIGKTLPVLILDDKRLIGEKSYNEIEEFLRWRS